VISFSAAFLAGFFLAKNQIEVIEGMVVQETEESLEAVLIFLEGKESSAGLAVVIWKNVAVVSSYIFELLIVQQWVISRIYVEAIWKIFGVILELTDGGSSLEEGI